MGRASPRCGIRLQTEYITVWKKQADGRWKVIFDTGSTLP
jgi:ketosteroid isomerase-like protein